MRNLTIYDIWPGLPPIQRGALCAVGLTAGFRVRFTWSEGPFRLDIREQDKEKFFFLRLYHFLRRDGFQPQADKKWLNILYELYQRLLVDNSKEAEKVISREELEKRLTKIRCFVLSLPVDEDDFLHRFKDCYKQWENFQICGEQSINSVNQKETGTYKQIFAQSAGGVESIDHAVQTLLHLLPGDAYRILDVGAGPGYVNRCLPPDRMVLAMDIDPDILKENRCATCVGDVLDIPLAEGAVDLCMACDVLEHIEPERLSRAIAELCRVSGRYLYLQVPYQEQLPTSFARCPKCGHIWHVNFHKSSFSLRRLLDLPGEGWKPLAVGFTGEISYQGEELQENRLLESLSLPACRVEGWNCPVCGTQSEDYLRGPFNNLHAACSASPQAAAAPRYSEIAVLFCKKDIAPAQRAKRLLVYLGGKEETGSGQTNLLRFCPDMLVSSVYTGSELLPFALCGNCRFDWEKDGQLLREDQEQPFFVSAAFPLRPASGDILRIQGNTREDNRLVVCMLDATGQEVLLKEIFLTSGAFDETLTIDYRFSASRAFVKIYFEREGLSLHSICLTDSCGADYRIYRAKKGAHLAYFQDGIAFFWYITPGEPVRMLPRLSQWLAAVEEERTPASTLIPDYIGLLHRIISEQRKKYEQIGEDQAKNAAQLSQQLKEKEVAVSLLESICCRLQLQVEEQGAALTLAEQLKEKETTILLLESVRCQLQLRVEEQGVALTLAEQRLSVLQLELAQTKEQLALCSAASTIRPKKRLALRAGATAVLRRICKASIRVVHKIPYLYPLLVRLGVKKAYNRLKLKIKSGESYE